MGGNRGFQTLVGNIGLEGLIMFHALISKLMMSYSHFHKLPKLHFKPSKNFIPITAVGRLFQSYLVFMVGDFPLNFQPNILLYFQFLFIGS